MLAIVFIFGLVVGSFTNVLISRFENLQTAVTGRSACPHCHHSLAWYDLIPVISFLLLGARCRYCKKPISWQYPLIELLVACLAVLCYQSYGLSVAAAMLFGVFVLLTAIAVIDYYHLVIPDLYVLPAIVLALLFSLTKPGGLSLQLLWGVLLAGGSLALLVIISREQWMGSGDIGLGVLIGLLGGLTGGAIGLVLAFVLGSLVGILLILSRRKSMKDMIPFGPFLVVGAYVAALWGAQIMNWYLVQIGYY